VLVLTEVTNAWVNAFRSNGLLDRYRYQVLNPYDGAGIGSAILSKLPIIAEHTDLADRRAVHSIDVRVGNQTVQIVALHPQSPNNGALVSSWIRQIDGHADIVRRRAGPIVLAGDLNASYLHPPYRKLISLGLHDAHEARGLGLTNSFPSQGYGRPVTRLDHALVSSDIAVLNVRNVVVPGSDHVAFVTTLAIKQS
jgi:endonuclease/exonuclease/phosphatase (EEP) superfamily protein YafD